MGFNVTTIQAIKDHWEQKSYEIYSILLAKDFNGIDDNELLEMLNLIHKNTGEKACCYYFTPQSWNVKEFYAYDLRYILGKASAMKKAIIKGTEEFEKMLIKNLKRKNSDYYIPALIESGKIWSFEDLGIFFFFRNSPNDPSDCFYVPISRVKWREQLNLILDEPSNYDQLIKRIKRKRVEIYKLLNGKEGWFNFELLNTGIGIIGVLMTIISLLPF